MFFRKKKDAAISLQEVSTLLANTIQGHDRNNDGVPDYLQRQDLPSMRKSNQDLNRWESETMHDVEVWIMNLRGYEFDPVKDSYKSISPPTLNEIGIRKLLTHAQVVVNKHSINTCLTSDDVHNICVSHTLPLIKWFKYNAKKSAISYSDLTPIIIEFDNLMYIILTRSIDDGQRTHTTNRTKLTGSVGQVPPSFPGG